jgi:hypothetical protein
MLEIYSNPVAIEPLMPIAERGRLAELSFEILQESGRLSGLVRSPWVFQEVASVVRGMNCYYSNLIEGHRTSPRDIERASGEGFCGGLEGAGEPALGICSHGGGAGFGIVWVEALG